MSETTEIGTTIAELTNILKWPIIGMVGVLFAAGGAITSITFEIGDNLLIFLLFLVLFITWITGAKMWIDYEQTKIDQTRNGGVK